MGVFDIEDIGKNSCKYKFITHLFSFDFVDIKILIQFFITIGKAVVKDARKCTTFRECIRNEAYPEFSEKINLGKRKDVFEFHVESVGMYSPEDIVFQSL